MAKHLQCFLGISLESRLHYHVQLPADVPPSMHQVRLGSCYLCGKPRLSYKLLALTWSIHGCCMHLGSKSKDDFALPFSLPLLFSLHLPFSFSIPLSNINTYIKTCNKNIFFCSGGWTFEIRVSAGPYSL